MIPADVARENGLRQHQAILDRVESALGCDIRTAWIDCRERLMTTEAIAQEWGIGRRTLLRWRKWFWLPDCPVKFHPISGADKPGTLENLARQLGYRSLRAYVYARNADGWTYAQMAVELGIKKHKSIGDALSRMGIELSPAQKYTEARVKSCSANLQKAHEKRDNSKHIWREHESMRLR